MKEISKKAQKELKQVILMDAKLPTTPFSLRGLLIMGEVQDNYNTVLRELQDFVIKNPKYEKSLIVYDSGALIHIRLLVGAKDILSRFVNENTYNKVVTALKDHNKVPIRINEEIEGFRKYPIPDLKNEVKSIRKKYQNITNGVGDAEQKAVSLCLCLAEYVLYSRCLKGRFEAFFLCIFRMRPDLTNIEREILIDAE